MATKIQVLNDPTYDQYIMMGAITASRNVIAENGVPLSHFRKAFAKRILSDPLSIINVFKSLVIVSFDTSTWEALTETQKINGAVTLCTSVFNEAAGI